MLQEQAKAADMDPPVAGRDLERVSFDGLLFDMDGTIIDSTAAVVKHWHTIGDEIGVPGSVILETSHGRRSIDILKILAPEKANWEYVCHMEGLIPQLYGSEAVEIPGARALLEAVTARRVPWAIVTSGTVPLVGGWLDVLGLPSPPDLGPSSGEEEEEGPEAPPGRGRLLVTAESVANGKPDPECYALGRRRLGLAGEDRLVLVLEDSPAGIRAGRAAGCRVLGLVTSHSLDQVVGAEPDWVVKDLASVRIVEAEGEGGGGKGGVTLEFRDMLWRKG